MGGLAVTGAFAQATQGNGAASAKGRRMLGELEVSELGLGMQNMARTFHATGQSRSEIYHILGTALDREISFCDTAEVYGPEETANGSLVRRLSAFAIRYGSPPGSGSMSIWKQVQSSPADQPAVSYRAGCGEIIAAFAHRPGRVALSAAETPKTVVLC